MNRRLIIICLMTITVVLTAFQFRRYLIALINPNRYTISERIVQYGTSVQERLQPYFDEIEVAYPPARVCLVGLKQEKTLEVWVANKSQPFKHLKDYPILGASGTSGPKLKRGDRQVPEGLYRIESLNPNSRYHLALRVNYPNQADLENAQNDGRTDLGGDIMIHGSTGSIGCLAMGDPASEDLFILAALTGIENISVILSPHDFRVQQQAIDMTHLPTWTEKRYHNIRQELSKLIQQQP